MVERVYGRMTTGALAERIRASFDCSAGAADSADPGALGALPAPKKAREVVPRDGIEPPTRPHPDVEVDLCKLARLARLAPSCDAIMSLELFLHWAAGTLVRWDPRTRMAFFRLTLPPFTTTTATQQGALPGRRRRHG